MKIIDKALSVLGYEKKTGSIKKRSYDGALVNRLNLDWMAPITSGDAEIRTRLKPLRARCRELERNNNYFSSWLGALESNVLGKDGVRLQMKIRDKGKFSNGKFQQGPLDDYANHLIDDQFSDFCSKKKFSVTGDMSGHEAQRLILRTIARDGDVLIRFVRGSGAGNEHNFSIQLIEPDMVDVDFNMALPDGGEIRMGVEFDKYMRRTAVHIFERHPGDLYSWQSINQRRIRIPANECIMPFMRLRITQSRGVPWATTAMTGLKMLDGYQEAELVAARTAAAKMGFFTKTNPDGIPGQRDPNDSGAIVMEAEPGTFQELPMGMDFKPWDPNHPTQAYEIFVKTTLRGIASGLGISYNRLANDLEGVNFSSMRSGLMEERELWMMIQAWFVESIWDPIFEAWLEMAMLSGRVNLPISKYEKFNAPEWKPRRWDWVDPMKDVQADIAAIEAGFRSRSSVIREAGLDPEEVDMEIKEDDDRAKSLGLVFKTEAPTAKADESGSTNDQIQDS